MTGEEPTPKGPAEWEAYLAKGGFAGPGAKALADLMSQSPDFADKRELPPAAVVEEPKEEAVGPAGDAGKKEEPPSVQPADAAQLQASDPNAVNGSSAGSGNAECCMGWCNPRIQVSSVFESCNECVAKFHASQEKGKGRRALSPRSATPRPNRPCRLRPRPRRKRAGRRRRSLLLPGSRISPMPTCGRSRGSSRASPFSAWTTRRWASWSPSAPRR